MKTKRIIGLVTFLVFAITVFAQDIHFSQYAETPTVINPALVGVTYNTRVIANYKDQWSTVGTKYQTMNFAFEQTIKHKKLKSNYFAVCANVFRDLAGDAKLRTISPNFGFAYLQKISRRMKLSGGVQSGFQYKTIDLSGLRWGEQYNGYNYDPNLPTGEPSTPRSSITSFDIGGGVNLNYVRGDKFLSAKTAAKFDAGISAYHFSLSRNSFIVSSEKLKTKFCAYFNGEFIIPNSINSIAPSFLIMRQSGNMEFITGAMFKFIIGDPSTYTHNKKAKTLGVGGYYRYKDAIIPSLLLQMPKYAIGFSYDVNVSPLTPASNRRGGFEVMLRYNLLPGYGINLGRSDTKPSY